MEDDEDRDQRLAEYLTQPGGPAAQADSLIGRNSASSDAVLYARRVIEEDLRPGPDGTGEWVYREAAGMLRVLDRREEARALTLIADTSAELAAASQEWHGRYLARPLTAAETASFELLESGRVRLRAPDWILGVDGAFYRPASIDGKGGASDPAVIVGTRAGTAEVVTGFRHEYQQAGWLNDRTHTSRGLRPSSPDVRPLWSCTEGPWSRAAGEERVLAWLLRGGDLRREVRKPLSPRAFTTYARSEIYLAWLTACSAPGTRQAGATAVRAELARRLLRAPGWATADVGGPFGRRALPYLDRLTATPVTEGQARTAALTIVREDTQAASAARRAERHAFAAGRTVPRPRPRETWGIPLPGQRRPDDPSPDPAPHR